MRKNLLFCLVILLTILFCSAVQAWDQAISTGYGFAAFNEQRHVGKIAGGDYYDFVHVTYMAEAPLSFPGLRIALEPFASYVMRPTTGVDLGFDAAAKYYLVGNEKKGFYASITAGLCYTTIGFKEQGTHLLGILGGGFGVRYKQFFVENRFRHYSNGGTASPNWSVNANVIYVGAYF